MPYSAMVHGKIVIGSGDERISIPVSMKLPPDQPGSLVVDYTADKPEDTTHLEVGKFADWVEQNLGPGVFDKTALPQSAQNLEVALKALHLETTGTNFAMAVLLGSKGADNTWKAEWKPISDLPLTLVDVTVDIKQG